MAQPWIVIEDRVPCHVGRGGHDWRMSNRNGREAKRRELTKHTHAENARGPVSTTTLILSRDIPTIDSAGKESK